MKSFLRRVAQRLQRRPPAYITMLGLVCILVLTVLDHFIPPGMSFTLFYVFAIAFVGWGAGARPALFASFVCVAMDLAEDWLWPRPYRYPVIVIWNAIA